MSKRDRLNILGGGKVVQYMYKYYTLYIHTLYIVYTLYIIQTKCTKYIIQAKYTKCVI